MLSFFSSTVNTMAALLLVLSCTLASHAAVATLSGFNYSSDDHPALFRHEQPPCFATNNTDCMNSLLLAMATCFSRAASIGSAITGADEDDRVVVVMPPPHRRHVDHHLQAGRAVYYLGFKDFLVSREKQLISNCSGSNLCSPPTLLPPSFPHVLQQPIILVHIDFTQLMAQSELSSYINPRRRRSSFDENYQVQNRRLLTRPLRYERRRKLLQVATHRQKASWQLRERAASVAVSALLALICTVAGLLLCCKRRTNVATITPERLTGSGPRRFSYSELAAATADFAEEKKVGRGGFGPVYRGCLGLGAGQDDRRRHVAVKVLSREQSAAQGVREFRAEVVVMSQLRHRNIVRLVGWCDDRRRGLLLVYELMPGGSLHTHLYSPCTPLTWAQRYKIALGLGSALLYLHTECDQCVVHGDIKPANVMLDASRGAAKLGDFGLARLVDHGAEPQTTQLVAGTVGYIDPELVDTRRPRTESDVYSFGVVLLEIACGRRPTAAATPRQTEHQVAAPLPLLASVRDMYDRGVILDTADPRLHGEFDELQMERLLVTGLWCAHRDPIQRPSIAQAMDVLRSPDARLPVLEATTRGSVQARYWEAQAYGDPSDESSDSSSWHYASSASAYLTPDDSTYLLAEE